MIYIIGQCSKTSEQDLLKISFRGFYKGDKISQIILEKNHHAIDLKKVYLLKITLIKLNKKILYGKILSYCLLKDFSD